MAVGRQMSDLGVLSSNPDRCTERRREQKREGEESRREKEERRIPISQRKLVIRM